MCVCVCVLERERERERTFKYVIAQEIFNDRQKIKESDKHTEKQS